MEPVAFGSSGQYLQQLRGFNASVQGFQTPSNTNPWISKLIAKSKLQTSRFRLMKGYEMSGLLEETLIILFFILMPIALILWSKRTDRKSQDAAAHKSEDEVKAE